MSKGSKQSINGENKPRAGGEGNALEALALPVWVRTRRGDTQDRTSAPAAPALLVAPEAFPGLGARKSAHTPLKDKLWHGQPPSFLFSSS